MDLALGKRFSLGQKLGRGMIFGLCLSGTVAMGQPQAWFADGFHGGIWGHYQGIQVFFQASYK